MPSSPVPPKLSKAQREHLAEMVKVAERYNSAGWHPCTAGEWAVARALARKGLLRHSPSQGMQPYFLEGECLKRAREAIKEPS